MSMRERDRLKVVSEVVEGRLGRREGARRLGITERQLRRSVRRYEGEGDAGLVHRSRGRPSNRRIGSSVREQAVAWLRQEKQEGFGPSFAAEKLAQYEGIAVSRETVRRWMTEEGLWQPRARKVTHREKRARREACGELVQMDTSTHDWFEGRGEEAVLISMVDDATGRPFLRFFPADTTAANMTLLRDYLLHHGRPLAIYADKASHFKTSRPTTVVEDLAGVEAETQFGRALRELDMEYIPAHSPQAKGRVERHFGVCQDRLIKELRLADVSTIQEANRFLEEVFTPDYIERFAQPPAHPVDAHRPIDGYDVDAILSHQEERTVDNDYTIRYRNVRYQIAPKSQLPGLRRSKVTVQERLDGSLAVHWRDRYLQLRLAPAPRPQGPSTPTPVRPPKARETFRPPADHPWRRWAPKRSRRKPAYVR
jgi:transposase